MKRPVDEREVFLADYLSELRANNAAVFVGAGLSRGSGYVDWVELLTPIAKKLGLDARRETDLVGLAQFHLNANAGNRHELNQLLVDEFSDLCEPSENHRLLARLPIANYWTTNYDRLIERALEDAGKRVDTKYTVKQLATTRRGRDAVLYKMHGDAEHPDDTILTKDDYERYHLTHAPFITALAGDLVEQTFLFLGFSFTDPNLDYVLGRIRATFEHNQRRHFCIMRKRPRRNGERFADYEYAITRQVLLTQDLMRFNIRTVFVEEYTDIAAILRILVNRFRRRTVFISGSAEDYGSWGRPATEDFLCRLAAALIDQDYRIASGFGLGIGSAVVTGATQQIYSSSARTLDGQLMLRPFPIGIGDLAERERTALRYRDELLSQAGLAIFVMGNKVSGGSIVDADGVRQEFERAKQRNVCVIPIGASGFVAEQLWREVMSDFDRNFPDAPPKAMRLFERLGRPTTKPDELLKPAMQLVNLLSKE